MRKSPFAREDGKLRPAPRGRPRDLGLSTRRRLQIIEAATKLFAARGYAETDLDAVIRALKCGKGTVYRYFRSKEELFLSCVARCMEELEEVTRGAAERRGDPLEKIRGALEGFLLFFDRHPHYVELLLQERANFARRRDPTYGRLQREEGSWWARLGKSLVTEGKLRDLPVDRMGAVASHLLFGTMFMGAKAGKPGRLRDWAGISVDILFNGVLSRRRARRRRPGSGRTLRSLILAAALVLSGVSPACAEPVPAKMSIEDVIVLLLKDNLAFKMLVHETVKADSEYMAAREMYAPVLSVESNYSDQTIPATGMTAFFGTEQYQWDTTTALYKSFMTGTTLTLALRESLFDANDPAFGDEAIGFYKPSDPPLHSPVVSLTLSQELLRDGFGYGRRRLDSSLRNLGTVKRRALISQASDLALMVLANYWQIGVAESALGHARAQLEESRKLRRTAMESLRFGKTQEYELHQFNAMVLGAEIKVAQAEREAAEARRTFERVTHVSADTELTGVTDLADRLPALDREDSVKSALSARADYLNAELSLASAEMGFEREKNAALPSLSLVGGVTSVANREEFADALGDAGAFKYPTWSVGIQVSYAFSNPGRKARLRDAWLAREQAKLNYSRVREEVRDDVLTKIEQAEVGHLSLAKAREAREEAEMYYRGLLERAKQGKASAFELKQALDGLTESRQQCHVALVGFNLALLAYNRAKEGFFEYYGVSLNELIARLKG